MIHRRGFLAGLGLLAAPAIIRTPGLLMSVKPLPIFGRGLLNPTTSEIIRDGLSHVATTSYVQAVVNNTPTCTWITVQYDGENWHKVEGPCLHA